MECRLIEGCAASPEGMEAVTGSTVHPNEAVPSMSAA